MVKIGTSSFCLGGEEEDRTPDLCIANAALSQLSYPPKQILNCKELFIPCRS